MITDKEIYFDQDGQMKSLTDPVNNRTSWTYNLLGRVSRETITLDKKLRTRFFYYDANGNITTKLDRNNRLTTWTYDKLNRPTSENWYETWASFYTNKPPIKKFQTVYNNKGKIASTEDNDNKFTFDYGIFGNELKQTQNFTGYEKPFPFTFYFKHDINDLKIEKKLTSDKQVFCSNNYSFDELNRINGIVQTNRNDEIKSLIIRYDNFGQITRQFLSDEDKPVIETKNRFDNAGRLTNISHTGNGKIYADYNLKWDDGNRITDFDFTYLNDPKKNNTSNYRYDKTSQLINASYNFIGNELYNFDLNGNRKTAEIQGQKQNYKTGEYNRLLSDANYRYEYDNEGNRISKIAQDGSTTKYFWDHRNRLIKVATPTETVEYIYDYKNRLVSRKQDKNETIFVHDDWQVILTFDSAKNKFYGYFWGTRQDELLCYEDYENYIDNWTLGDHLNTIRDVVKSDGTVAAHLEYNAFGKLISDIKNDLLLFGYTGKLFDKSSDLQWNINRWYDSNAGRWVSEDPIAIDGGDSNLYRYADNSVIDVIDSWGYFSITSFTFPGNFEVNIPFIYGTEIVITLDITATDNNCCLSYQLAGGVVLSIRDRVLGLIGRAIPQRIKNYLANRLPDISANIMLMGDLGKLDNPYTNRNKCSCVKCKSTCLLGITGGVGIGDTSRGGGKGSEREDGSTKRRVLAIGASGSVQGTYDYCSGDRQFSITAFISVGINFGFYAYNRNFTGTIWKYP